MRHHGRVPETTQTTDPLDLVALDIERHVASDGWDQPLRLFALVPTAELVREAPQVAGSGGVADLAPDALSAVEQDGVEAWGDIESALAGITWPATVAGAAVAVERIVVPPEAERDLPEDPEAAVAVLAAHPERHDVRLVVAVLRGGRACCLLRQRAHDADDRVAKGEQIAPGLVAALAATLL